MVIVVAIMIIMNLKLVKIISAIINIKKNLLRTTQADHFALGTKNCKPTIRFINKVNIHKKMIIKAKTNLNDKKLFKTK
jgi:hypothetical protein